ncbi:MAG: sensor histidine kinase [Chitinophagaceae bacterium]|nr:sensor histidine kinase [Chitinophagaceae bacterium]
MAGFQLLKKISIYSRIEAGFFIFYFVVFPFLSDIEYALYEPVYTKYSMSLTEKITHRLVYGIASIPPYLVLYTLLINKLLIKKRYGAFIAAFPLFLLFLNIYKLYGEYWLISQLTFLPQSITRSAEEWFKASTPLHFSIAYVIRETLVLTAQAYFIHFIKHEKKMNALRQAKLETDLNYLKAQIQPHFFFNTLNNIYSLAQQQSSQTAELVAQLSHLMRYVIYETNQSKVPLSKEAGFLKNYVAVESVRYNEKIAVLFDTQGISESASIEPLLLLPFVENVFKHGLQEETQQGFAEIIICLNESQLIFETYNSKPEAKQNNSNHKGIGIENTIKRLNLLYPEKYSLHINDSDTAYKLILTMELS